jgi:hypothetical protein
MEEKNQIANSNLEITSLITAPAFPPVLARGLSENPGFVDAIPAKRI